MKKFLIQLILFSILLTLIWGCALFFIPNKRIANNSLFANIDKINRIASLPSPKIVFAGGSNLAYGLNSKKIQDSLCISVVNMGLHAGFGFKYMMEEVKPYINSEDIIVISPEYQHFTSQSLYDGEKVLVALLVDVNRKNINSLSLSHIVHLLPLAAKYATSKLMRKQLDIMDEGGGKSYESVYKRHSFNELGDETMHWEYPNINLPKGIGENTIDLPVLDNVITDISDFKQYVEGVGAVLYVIPPAFQQSHYKAMKPTVMAIEEKLGECGITFDVATELFAYPDSLFFNTAYHLDKIGGNLRTEKVIEFLKQKLDRDEK